MRNILILGAGKSSVSLIDYLSEHAASQQWLVTVADMTAEQALQKTKGRERTNAIGLNLNNESDRRALINDNDIIISMLPATLHLIVANDCLALAKNLVTPSYISDQMRALNGEVEKCGLIFMNEMGLDPGIDHMSAMQLIDELKAKGKHITGFESHCGGLVAPESDDNPWHYKFTWNPRNVVLAGQGEGGIHYLKDGKHVDLKYEGLFRNTSVLEVEGYGKFESYPNRDSLKYISEYGLEGIQTMYRGTLRVPPFCKGWNVLVKYGYTDDTTRVKNLKGRLAGEYLFEKIGGGVEQMEDGAKMIQIPTAQNCPELADNEVADMIVQLFLDANQFELSVDEGTNARILQSVLEEKWKMRPGDKDMVVMVHEITYEDGDSRKKLQSSLVYIGKDEEHTAMATTVGLPVAIVTKMILNGEISRRGVLMPKYPEIYNPILAELKSYGITFKEKVLNM